MKQGVILSFLGRTQDRFSEYQRANTVGERLETAARIPGLKGVEIVYPYETGEPAAMKSRLEGLGLEFAAINANIKREAAFVPGALSRPDAAIRSEAVALIKGAKDYAAAVGAAG